MQTIETENRVEAQRCRRALYSGLATAITLNGSKYRANVLAVMEVPSAEARRWIVKIAPKLDKAVSPRQRYKPALR